jgi:hypothetical protein
MQLGFDVQNHLLRRGVDSKVASDFEFALTRLLHSLGLALHHMIRPVCATPLFSAPHPADVPTTYLRDLDKEFTIK